MKIDGGQPNSLIRVLSGESVKPPPVWLMRQAGRYLPEYRALRMKAGSFWALCTTPELATEVTLQPIRRFDLDAAIVFSDILTIPAALGQDVRIEDGSGPRLAAFAGVGALDRDSGHHEKLLNPVYETLRMVRTELSSEKALIGFAGAPWTLVTYMLGANGTPEERVARARASVALGDLLDLLVGIIARHLSIQLKAGADVVQIFDSWAGGLNDQEFAEWIIAPTKTLIAHLRENVPRAWVIGFPRGATETQYLAYANATGVDGLSIDTTASLPAMAKRVGGKVVLQGNLDPQVLVAGGSELNRAVDEILGTTRSAPFIFNLGHGVVPETPPAHVEALVKRVRASGAP